MILPLIHRVAAIIPVSTGVVEIDGNSYVDALSKGERVSVISLDVGILRVVRAG